MTSDLSAPYVYRPGGPSWHQWNILRAQRQIALESSRGAAQAVVRSIADSKHEAREAIESIERVVGDIGKDVSRSLDDISLAIGEFHADFNWHMDNVTIRLKDIQSILAKLHDEMSRRHRTEAFEFFWQSREYAEHQMFEKALQSIETAIHGDERARGYDLEWQFWDQLAILRLRGLKADQSENVIDLKKSEEAFLQAARLAARTAPKAAAVSLVGAAVAAYADGRLPIALEHIYGALSHHPDLVEAHWNLGRYLWQAGKFQEAAEGFYRALSIDPNYAMRFKADEALQQPADETQKLEANLIQLFRQRFDRNWLDRIRQQAKLLSRCIVDLGWDASAVRSIEGNLESLGRLAQSDSVLNAAKLGTGGESAASRLHNELNHERSLVADQLNKELSQTQIAITSAKADRRSGIIAGTYGLAALLSGPLIWYADPGSSVGTIIIAMIVWPLLSLGSLFSLLFPRQFTLVFDQLPFPLDLALGCVALPIVSFGVALVILSLGYEIKTRDVQQRGVRMADVKARLGV